MGIEVVCGGCGCPIGVNGFSQMIGGYCVKCSANILSKQQLESVRAMNPNTAPKEKAVFGERIPNDPKLIAGT